jgi:D-glycero-D-manno-heptose 1,7-bisphosphate phosphatase
MKLIILDRDGVINQDSDNYIKTVDEFIPLPGSLEAIARLNQAGYRVAVATNQSGIARGFYDLTTLNAMHEKLRRLLASLGGNIDMIAYCPHGPDDGCDCRKPKPGMYQDIARRMEISLKDVPVIGDSLRDLQAAQAVNARPILVRTGKGEQTIAKGEGLEGIPIYDDLAGAVNALLEEQG